MTFRNDIGKNIFDQKYRYLEGGCGTWNELCEVLVNRVCSKYMTKVNMSRLIKYMQDMKFMPGGRYLYYAGRKAAFFNNCMLLNAEDTREGWAELGHKHFMALMSGGGVGTYYGKIRPKGSSISKTGSIASGPIPLMKAMNEIGRNVKQGGSRRSALWAGLNWDHSDIDEFLTIKDWDDVTINAKANDFNFPAPLDMTNISVCFDKSWATGDDDRVFNETIYQACKTSEPGMSFDIHSSDILRNPCCEVVSPYDSSVCNLGSVNMSRINSLDEMYEVCELGNQFLICGTLEAELPYEKMYTVREMYRLIGLGLMGVHEWLIKRGHGYEPNYELSKWLREYAMSEDAANSFIDHLGISPLHKYRSVAPTGTLSLLAGTTGGIEPVYASGIKRRYLHGDDWIEEVFPDPTVKYMVGTYGVNPNEIETAHDLAKDVERRIEFQAYIQDYVDMGISSTINLPAWGTEYNNEKTVLKTAKIVRKYSNKLRGLTFYADGSRGGQPITAISYDDAVKHSGKYSQGQMDFLEESSCKSGVCGI